MPDRVSHLTGVQTLSLLQSKVGLLGGGSYAGRKKIGVSQHDLTAAFCQDAGPTPSRHYLWLLRSDTGCWLIQPRRRNRHV